VGLAPSFVVLLPPEEAVVRRGLARKTHDDLDEAVYRKMHREFVAAFEGGAECVVRNDGVPVAETADEVLRLSALRHA
jgi:hypothetical protein